MYESLLVAVDGSEPADAAVRQSVSIAQAFDASMTFVRVLEDESLTERLTERSAKTERLRDHLDSETERAISTAEDLAADVGVSCDLAIERGTPHEELAGYADRLDADLIAMGTHGQTGLERLLLGSVTERVLRTSDVPVMTTHSGEASQGDVEAILHPTDGSDCAEQAMDHAVALAKQYDATLHALSVVDVQSIASAYSSGPVLPEVVENLRDRHERAVESAAETMDERGVDGTTSVWEGSPHQSIDEYVDDEDIDLTVMGTHGRSGLDRYLIGSVTERVVRSSDVPVVSVPE